MTNKISSISEKESFMITWVTHNSRVSERMIKYGVKRGESIQLNIDDEILIMGIIRDIVIADRLKVISMNICMDHVHMIIVCGYEERDGIVKKLKGRSAYEFFRTDMNISKGLKPLVRTDVPSRIDSFERDGTSAFESMTASRLNKGFQPLVPSGELPVSTRFEIRHLWAQKYHWRAIESDEYLYNAIDYVQNNRIHHELTEDERLQNIINQCTCSVEEAFNNK